MAPSSRLELFTAPVCTSALDTQHVPDLVDFGQVLRLLITLDALPYSIVVPTTGLGATRTGISKSLVVPSNAAHYRGIPYPDALDGKATEALRPMYEVVDVPDAPRAIATRSVQVGPRRIRLVGLEPSGIDAMAAGAPALVRGREGDGERLYLLRPVGITQAPATNTVIIHSLGAFLRDPTIRARDASPIPLRLTTRDVESLTRYGTTQVSHRGQPVSLVYSAVTTTTSNSLESPPTRTDGGSSASTGQTTASPTYDPPLVAEAMPPSFELAMYLAWSQRWTLDGYSKGRLINSLTLAPGEETAIEVFTWDRRKTGTESTGTVESDVSTEISSTLKDQTDTLRELTRQNEFNWESSLKVGINVADIGLNAGAQLTQSIKDRVTAQSRYQTQHVSDSTRKAADRLKASRTTKVSESAEFGREERVTRKVKNINQGRTLTIDYFETSAHYTVETRFDSVGCRLCVLVPNPMRVAMDRSALRVFEGVLSRALLAPELKDGFKAARYLDSRDRLMRLIVDERSWARNSAGVGAAEQAQLAAAEVKATAALTATIGATTSLLRSDFMDMFVSQNVPSNASIESFRRWLYRQRLWEQFPGLYRALERVCWQGTTTITSVTSTSPAENRTWESLTPEEQLAAIGGELAALGTERKLRADDLFADEAAVDRAIALAVGRACDAGVIDYDLFDWAANFLKRFKTPGADAGLAAALDALAQALGDMKNIGSRSATDAETLATGLLSQLNDAYGLKSTAEALEREDALLQHLRRTSNYYRFRMFQGLSAAQQTEELAPFGTLFGWIRPTLLGYVDDKLVFPIDLAADSRLQDLFDVAIASNGNLSSASDVATTVLPTPGVAAETRLGDCDGCEEFIRESRARELEKRRQENRRLEADADLTREEVARYHARLQTTPPTLADPVETARQSLVVKVESEPRP